jgi:hypothetical protein
VLQYLAPLLARLDALTDRVNQLERHRLTLVAKGEDSRPARRGKPATPDRSRIAEMPNVCRREGDYWQMSYAGTTVRLRDTKGLRYIAQLLARQGEEVHVADLATGGVGIADGPKRHDGASMEGHLGAVLDPRAMREYRARLADLREDLDEGVAAADTGRAERARREIEVITRALSVAYGLGGRARTSGDPADRIRKAVTIQIHRARERIRTVHGALGRHFENALRTGFVCSYRPEHPVEWSL